MEFGGSVSMVDGAAGPAENPAWFKSSQPWLLGACISECAGRSREVLRSSLVACAVTGLWVPGRWAFGSVGFSPRRQLPSRPPPIPFSSKSLARAPGRGQRPPGAQEAVPGRGRPTYPGRASSSRRADPTLRRPASSRGSIRPQLRPRFRRCWGRAPHSAGSASRASAGREARPGWSPRWAGSGARRAVS